MSTTVTWLHATSRPCACSVRSRYGWGNHGRTSTSDSWIKDKVGGASATPSKSWVLYKTEKKIVIDISGGQSLENGRGSLFLLSLHDSYKKILVVVGLDL
ncbi:hypothetical protein PVAP13_3NG079698 [Panicum virgatum]|uniref:Uncharacterized protein n=1 Tax=Panicum virgatum TaxID=38727 RepID=A0A8T0U371_PANVG|nr:hypothetical protein PVAP13_3NG079698 [Panicum virgatum]